MSVANVNGYPGLGHGAKRQGRGHSVALSIILDEDLEREVDIAWAAHDRMPSIEDHMWQIEVCYQQHEGGQ